MDLTEALHPYYPLDADIAWYIPNELSAVQLLSVFGAVCACWLLSAAFLIKRINSSISKSDLSISLWFLLSASIHCIFEGFYVLNHRTIAVSQSFLAQLWKEYALSDSRYLLADTFIVSIETVTATTIGPLALLATIFTATSHPFRHPLQITVSVLHLYGASLYYATSTLAHLRDGISYSRPEPLYFYGYYIGMNLFWIIIPAGLVCSSAASIGRTYVALDRAERALKVVRVLREEETQRLTKK